MNDQSGSRGGEGEQPVRSRWTPKSEQILILETIFNNGMVNPPKEETIRIRKLLEQFGPVGDANVFYWFQNRRSRSRRRQRQIQATLNGSGSEPPQPPQPFDKLVETTAAGLVVPNSLGYPAVMNTGSSSSSGSSYDHPPPPADLLSFSAHLQKYEQNYATNFPYQSEMITVFINGVATEVGRGVVDMKGMFGADLMLYHSSGVPVELNEYGFLVQGLQHGESYFLVQRLS